MYVGFDNRVKWTQKMQRNLKKQEGCLLSYKQTELQFKVYLCAQKIGKYITVKYSFGESKLPEIKFSLPFDTISDKVKSLISYVLKSFMQFTEENGGEKPIVSISFDKWSWEQEDKEAVKSLMTESNLIQLYPDNHKTYTDATVQEKVFQLYNAHKEIQKKHHVNYWEITENSKVRFSSNESFPYHVTYTFQSTVDREVTVVWRHKESNFKITFRSPYYKKEVVLEEITSGIFNSEYEQFVAEDELKELVSEPKMNKAIEGRLSYLSEKFYPSVKVKELFDFLMTEYSIEELTEYSKKRNDINVSSKTEYLDFMDTERDRNREKYYMYIVHCFGKFLRYESIDVKRDSSRETNKEEKQFTLHDSLEEARTEQRKWLKSQI